MFARACQVASPPKGKVEGTTKEERVKELVTELDAMKAMLISKMANIYQSTSEDMSMSAPSIWSSPDDQDAVATALSPKLQKAQGGVTELLYEVVTLEVSLVLFLFFSLFNNDTWFCSISSSLSLLCFKKLKAKWLNYFTRSLHLKQVLCHLYLLFLFLSLFDNDTWSCSISSSLSLLSFKKLKAESLNYFMRSSHLR